MYQLFCLVRLALPFLSIRPFRCELVAIRAGICRPSNHLRPLAPAATCGRKWPQVAASGRKWPVAQPVGFEISKAASLALFPSFASFAATCSHLQPLAATCSHLQPLAATCIICIICRHLQPLAAWPQVAARASGRKWPHVAARGRTWLVALLVGFEISRAVSLAAMCIICSHLQPIARSHFQPLPATCSHSSGRKWPLAATCGHLRPLAATRVAASGCKWLLFWTSNTARFATSMKPWVCTSSTGTRQGGSCVRVVL